MGEVERGGAKGIIMRTIFVNKEEFDDINKGKVCKNRNKQKFQSSVDHSMITLENGEVIKHGEVVIISDGSRQVKVRNIGNYAETTFLSKTSLPEVIESEKAMLAAALNKEEAFLTLYENWKVRHKIK